MIKDEREGMMKKGKLFMKRTLLLILCITICFSGCSRQEAEIDPEIGTEKSGTPEEAAEPETDEVPEDSVSPEEIANGEIRYLLDEEHILLPLIPEEENRLYRDGNRYLWTAEYEKAHEIFKQLAEEEETVEALNGMAVSQYYNGDYDMAEGNLRKALEKESKPKQAIALYNNLGVVMDGLIKFDEGNACYMQASMGQKEEGDGTDGLTGICIKVNQSINEAYRGGMENAQLVMEQQLEAFQQMPEEDALFEAYLKKSNAMLNKDGLDNGGFINEMEKYMDIFKKIFGENHPMPMFLLKVIADANLEEGDVQQAIKQNKLILEKLKKHLGEEHLLLADIYVNLGLCYRINEMYEEEMQCDEKAMEIYQKTIAGRLNLYMPYNNIAGIYYYYGKYEEAMEYLLKAYQLLLFRDISYDSQIKDGFLNSIKKVYSHMGLDTLNFNEWLEEQMAQIETEVWPEGFSH